MIDITERPEKCYAMVMGQCVVLIRTECEGCRFYKPKDCEDWVRVDKDGKEYLMTPEEQERRKERVNNGNSISKQSGIYWRNEKGTTGKGRL